MPALLDSLLAQDFSEVRILARDDASRDETPAVLADYQSRQRESFRILTGEQTVPRGAAANFAALMRAALDDGRCGQYFLFCDQDDIWHPEKVSALVDTLKGCKDARPALSFCDMRVVDASLNSVAASFLDYQRLPRAGGLPRLLVQNHISGCACLFNRAALALADPLPAEALMHDWWVSLLTAATGEIRFCERALVDYRQHGSNIVGATRYDTRYLLRRATGNRGVRLTELYRQADAIGARLAQRGCALPDALTAFSATARLSLPRRVWSLWRGGFTRRGWARNLPLLLGSPDR